jgi:hypothetical protein
VQLGFEHRRIATAELLGKRALRPHLLLSLFGVIEVMGESCLDVGESDGRKVGDNLVGRHALVLMPHHDIEYTDAVTSDACLAAANAGRLADPILAGHNSSGATIAEGGFHGGDGMTSFRKIAVSATCVVAICGAAILWPVYKQKVIERKFAEAAKECRVRAEQRDAEAQSRLGKMYSDGKGVPRDFAEAVRWYRKAADQGYAKAQHNIGVMFYRGKGVQQDYGEALRWYRKAADQGYAPAQYGVGFVYSEGKGVLQDCAEAVRWSRQAAEQAEQINEAERLAKEWKPRPTAAKERDSER